MRSSPVRTGFTAWVENLAREQTEGLVAVALREGLTGDDAMEAVQEAFITLLALPQARSLAEHREDAAAFLAVIVRNAARQARRRPPRERPPLAVEARLDDTPSPATLIAAAEQHLAILGCVRKLDEIQRAVVLLRVIEEVASSDAAGILALGPGALAALLQRAKDALQLCIAE